MLLVSEHQQLLGWKCELLAIGKCEFLLSAAVMCECSLVTTEGGW